jgi:DNA-binding MarR family transcriptional regulator
VTSKKHPDQIGHELAMHVRAAAAHLRRRSNLAFAPFGMTTDQYVLLTVLAQQRKATQQELVALCFSDTATIGAMVSLLETKGLVKRTPHPRDRRALRVSLTRSGRHLAKQMRSGSAAIRADLLSLFSEQELATLMKFLARLAGAMRPPQRTASRTNSPRVKSAAR